MTAPAKPVDIGSLVTQTPGVYGGRPCLEGTRFPILSIAVAYNAGDSPEKVATQFSLDLVRVYAGFAYYLANREAIDADLEEETAFHDRMVKEQRAALIAAGKLPA